MPTSERSLQSPPRYPPAAHSGLCPRSTLRLLALLAAESVRAPRPVRGAPCRTRSWGSWAAWCAASAALMGSRTSMWHHVMSCMRGGCARSALVRQPVSRGPRRPEVREARGPRGEPIREAGTPRAAVLLGGGAPPCAVRARAGPRARRSARAPCRWARRPRAVSTDAPPSRLRAASSARWPRSRCVCALRAQPVAQLLVLSPCAQRGAQLLLLRAAQLPLGRLELRRHAAQRRWRPTSSV